MTGLALDLRLTLRSLRRTAALLGVALLTIALGVGVNTAMFSVVNAVLLQPLPYAAPDRLVSLWPEKRWSVGMLDDVRERTTSYQATSAYRSATYTLLGGDLPEAVSVAMVTPSHFDVLAVRPVSGRAFTDADAAGGSAPVVLLAHDFWQTRFGGDPALVGRTIRLAGSGLESRTVVGILPADFTALPAGVQAWVPLVVTPGAPGSFGGYGMSVVGRLEPGVAPERASTELRGLVPALTPEHPTQFRPIRYSPVDVVPLLDLMTRDVRTPLVVLLGAVGFILLIACTNVANLLLARTHGRQRELAIQMALGCSRRRVARQLVAESLVLGVGGGAIGILAAVLALPAIRRAVEDQLPRTAAIGVDVGVLLFAATLSVATGLLFGLLPALHAMRAAPGDVMRATAGRGQSQGRAGGRVNDLFVAAEIALSLMLLVGAGLMLKSLWQLTRVDTGFSSEHVLALQLTLPPGRYDSADARTALLRQVEARVGALPGVVAVGTIDHLPLGNTSSGIPYAVEGQEVPPGTSQVIGTRMVTPSYFDVLRIPLRSGRLFERDEAAAEGEAPIVVNEAFARVHWADGSPIGARIVAAGSGEPIGRIVGVVGSVRQREMREAPDPEMYLSTAQQGWPDGHLLVRGAGDVPSRDLVLAALRDLERDVGVRNVRTMDEVVRAATDDTRFYARLLTGFAVVALVLGIVGVYGVMTYAASRRTREFGVRLALGSTPRELLMAVLRRAMAPVAAGVVLGLGGALALARLLASLLFDVAAADPWVLGGVAALLAIAAAAAALVPAARAARVSPVVALTAE